MPVSHHNCTADGFLGKIENAPNGTLVVQGESMYFMVEEGDDKQIFLAPDLTSFFSTLEIIAFVTDVKLVMARRAGRPVNMSFP